MQTANGLRQYVGTQAYYRTGNGLAVLVKILDAREVFGKIQFEIMPLHGSGKAWVDAGSTLERSA